MPEDLLAYAQEETGKGITETVREGLQRLARELRGKVKFSMAWQEMKDKA